MAKLVVWGRDRDEAIRRTAGALDEFGAAGVRTTIPFHRAVMRHPDFRAGRLSTGFVDRAFPDGLPRTAGLARVAALVAAVHAHRRAAEAARAPGPAPAAGPAPWALAGRPGGRRRPR
jgi:acetyl/propionyl-CoA carboxylase alpha subunit